MKRSREESDENEGTKSLNFPLVELLPVGDDPSGSIGTSTGPANNVISRKLADEGHRYGNFHNYYTFHPVSNRTEHIGEMLNFVAKQWNALQPAPHKALFRYTDIGCNEGDLTLEVATLLSDHITKNFTTQLSKDDDGRVIASHGQSTKVFCTGFDLDADLIRRAETKAQKDAGIHPNIQATFKVLDVLHEDIVPQGGESTVSTCCIIPSEVEYSTDLSTLFSTTMWIHIHGGDDGLRRVLQNICALTRFWILLEPQPSKCYGQAAFRLRRLGLPPIDVSNERLRLRSNIDEAIEGIMKEFHFERVKMSNNSSCNKNDLATLENTMQNEESVAETRTQWNRSLRLYQRVNTPDAFNP